MGEVALLFALSQIPVVVLFTYFYLKDKHGREPIGMLFWSFMLGVFSTIPAVGIEWFFLGAEMLTAPAGILSTAGKTFLI